jgi:hypothetical protein
MTNPAANFVAHAKKLAQQILTRKHNTHREMIILAPANLYQIILI